MKKTTKIYYTYHKDKVVDYYQFTNVTLKTLV